MQIRLPITTVALLGATAAWAAPEQDKEKRQTLNLDYTSIYNSVYSSYLNDYSVFGLSNSLSLESLLTNYGYSQPTSVNYQSYISSLNADISSLLSYTYGPTKTASRTSAGGATAAPTSFSTPTLGFASSPSSTNGGGGGSSSSSLSSGAIAGIAIGGTILTLAIFGLIGFFVFRAFRRRRRNPPPPSYQETAMADPSKQQPQPPADGKGYAVETDGRMMPGPPPMAGPHPTPVPQQTFGPQPPPAAQLPFELAAR